MHIAHVVPPAFLNKIYGLENIGNDTGCRMDSLSEVIGDSETKRGHHTSEGDPQDASYA